MTTMNINDVIQGSDYGCWIDCGHHSADELSYRIIKLAHSFGYDVNMKQVEDDLANYDNMLYEEQGDVSQALWEESGQAIEWMNYEIQDKRYYFFVDDNSLYLEFDDMEGAEYNAN